MPQKSDILRLLVSSECMIKINMAGNHSVLSNILDQIWPDCLYIFSLPMKKFPREANQALRVTN